MLLCIRFGFILTIMGLQLFYNIGFYNFIICSTSIVSEYVKGNKNVIYLKKNVPLASQLIVPDTEYVLRYSHNLKGTTIKLPSGCIMNFQGGSINNGTLSGDINVTGDYGRSLNVICQGKILTKNFEVYHSTQDIDKSKIENCTAGIIICESLNFVSKPGKRETGIKIQSNLSGKNKNISISFDRDFGVGIEIVSDDVVLAEITIKKEVPNKWNNRYAVVTSRSHITIQNCNIYGSVVFLSESEDKLSTDITFENNNVVANFSPISWRDNPYDLEKDAIVVKSVDNVNIQNNTFTFIDVNRGFKLTSHSYKENGKSVFFHFSKNIKIANNSITAYTTGSNKSKQLIDCYIGTQNVDLLDNQMEVSGFSVIFENKTQKPIPAEPTINRISGNSIICDCRLCFINTTNKDQFIIENNDVIVKDAIYPFTAGSDDFFNGNAFCSCPTFSSLTIENNNFSYIGHKSVLFFLVVSSSNGNADVFIKNNKIDSMAPIVASGINSLSYINNSFDNLLSKNYELGLSCIKEIKVEKRRLVKTGKPQYIINFQKGGKSGVLSLILPDDAGDEYDLILYPSRVKKMKCNLNVITDHNISRIIKKK